MLQSFASRAAACLAAVVIVFEGAGAAEATPAERLVANLGSHSLTTLDGESGRIATSAASVSVIHFWASWCAPCKKELPLLDDLAASLAPRGVRFAAISIDSDADKARRFVERNDIDLPVFVDGPDGLAESIALTSVPSTFVVDRSGRVTFVSTGSSEEELTRLRAHLEESVGGTPMADYR